MKKEYIIYITSFLEDIMNILAINGSHHKDGDIQFLLETFSTECKKLGADVEIVNATDALLDAKHPFCIKCTTPCEGMCYKGTKLQLLLGKMSSADAIIVGSPVYFGSVSGQIKCLFDKTRAIRTSLTGKIGAGVVCGGSRFGGQESTVSAIHDIMFIEGMTVVGSAGRELGVGQHGVCAHSPASKDEFAISRTIQLAHRIVEELKK